ncbi:MAG: acyltransferase [Prolixibacteraceae bacterium]|nr:acyltransferase [Prolixibacteraceae bacterium]
MNKYQSDKLRTISFFLILLVVMVHSTNLSVRIDANFTTINKGVNSFFQNFISDGIAKIASPLFFAISGYLFFLNINEGKPAEFLEKYKKRFRTLVIPYLLWSIFGLIFYFAIQSIPYFKPFFTRELIRDYSFSQVLTRIFLQPIPYQLWFIRDLTVLVLISPLIHWLLKNLRNLIVLFFLILWFLNFNYVIFDNRSILFFTSGAYFSVNRINPHNFKVKHQHIYLTICWITLVLCKTILVHIGYSNNTLILILQRASILFGILTIWLLYDKLFKNTDLSKTRIYNLFQYTFFIYVFHEPTITIVKKSLYFFLGTTELSSFLIYLLAPTITLFFSIIVASYLKNIAPVLYKTITGKR